MSRTSKLLVGAVALATVAAGCGSSKSTSSGGGGGGSGETITVGLLGDFTGLAASGNKTSPLGVQAGISLAAQQGYHIKFVQADTESSPSGALSAAQTLVEQDHVSAVLAVSSLTLLAAPYLKKQGIPVIGVAEDGSEWIGDTNMFSVYGFLDSTKVSTTGGAFFKMEGVTSVGAVGYGISPQSANSAKATGVSAQAAGLQVGYIDSNFAFGSTNVQPVAIAMKDHGVNGVVSETDPNTSFSLITAMRQAGDNPKVALFPDGYGGDISQAGPGALQTGQGVFFSLSFEPVEMQTTATKQFQTALSAAGVNGDPTYGEYAGYASVALLVAGLKTAGANPSHAALISALNGVTNFDAWGLLGSHTLSMADRNSTAIGVDGCLYVVRLSGSTFQLVSGADPICGTEIPGKSV
ncbi:MAG TPA: ABC transporter substrate-binding protein [Acidimicrobiales bacterium]|jgi:branched-chain amino acid transport system substrate-binding protein|nr:ABC transporter substrate-binding protein [Acidimicrobiales bacterium]